MTSYSAFNLLFASLALPVSALFIRSRRQLRACVFTTVISILIAYPWNAYAIAAGVWASIDSGPRLYAVPLNEIWFVAICTFVSSSVLSWERGDSRSKHS